MLAKLGNKADLPPLNHAREFSCNGKMLCVANLNGELHAMENICLHRGGPLGQGVIEGDKVICPWHGWHWDPKTGQAVHSSAAKLHTYALTFEGEEVLVEIV
jgi:nitrite reductase (NADH) small subunit